MFGIYPYEGIGVRMAEEALRMTEGNQPEAEAPKREPRFRIYNRISHSLTLLIRRRTPLEARPAGFYEDPYASEC